MRLLRYILGQVTTKSMKRTHTRIIHRYWFVSARLFEFVHLVRGRADVEEDDLRIAVDEPPAAVDPVSTLSKLFHSLTWVVINLFPKLFFWALYSISAAKFMIFKCQFNIRTYLKGGAVQSLLAQLPAWPLTPPTARGERTAGATLVRTFESFCQNIS